MAQEQPVTRRPRKWVDYDRETHGNPFELILREAARRRDQLESEKVPSHWYAKADPKIQ